MNADKLSKLQEQVRIGGKGSARRKKKVVHCSATDEKHSGHRNEGPQSKTDNDVFSISMNSCAFKLMMNPNENDMPERCTVCLHFYNEFADRPRNLPCGHTFCSRCVQKGITEGHITCPSCNFQHRVTFVTDLPVNFGMLDLIRKLYDLDHELLEGIGKELKCQVKVESSSMRSRIYNCEDVLFQLGEYHDQLRDWKRLHQQLQDRLDDLVDQNKEALKLLELEDKSVVDMTSQGEARKRRLQDVLININFVNTEREVLKNIGRTGECHAEIKEWIEKCNKLFPDVNTVHTVSKVQETIREALEMMTTKKGATASSVHQEHSGCCLVEKATEVVEEISLKQLTVEDLRTKSEPVRGLVESGRVVAVQQDKEGCRFASITLHAGQLRLHSLLRQALPADALTIQHNNVTGMLVPSATLAFLDLGWAGLKRGRVIIRLSPDTPLARQFVLLCTGERGPSYINTKFYDNRNENLLWHWVTGGNYESEDNVTGAPLLPDLNWEYEVRGRIGDVGSFSHGSSHSVKFVILTSNLHEGQQKPDIFGEVVSGLNVVKTAAKESNVTKVTVMDCGVVLPQ